MRTLRTRILIGYGIIVVMMAAGGVITARIQHQHLFDAVDSRIQRIIDSPRFIEKRIESGRTGKPAGAGLSDTYLGIINNDGESPTTLSAPDDDADFAPVTAQLVVGDPPRTISVSSGTSTHARAALFALQNGVTAIVAIPLTSTERSLSRLTTTLVLVGLGVLLVISLLTVWILLLGIRPIRELTSAAHEVAIGESPDVDKVRTQSSEARDLKSAINALISKAKEDEDKMRRFVADASHELRTPLTTLRGYASLLTSNASLDDSTRSDSLTRISEESLRMARLVDDLFMLTRADTSQVIEASQFDLTALIEDIAADLRVVQPGRQIDVSSPATFAVVADRALITQAILALTTNALRHTPPSASLTITTSTSVDRFRVEVTDTGPGIPESHLPFLFDRFYSVTTTGSQAGSGLGLAIVASIIERHGGSVGVSSVVGTGTTFWFEIPNSKLD